jgi:oligoendopeptidase F
MAAVTQSAPIRWDLSALFSGMDDPRIEETWSQCMERAAAYAERYRGKINSSDLTAETLSGAISELESLIQDSAKPGNYGQLLFAGDSSDPKIGAFMQKQMEKSSALSVQLMFFELELQDAPEEVIARIIDDPKLAQYKHYITVARKLSPHKLTEAEEIILEETANTGSRAWVRLFEEVTSNYDFKLRRPGSDEVEELSQEEVLNLLRESDRELRQAAADALSEGLVEMQRVLVFIYNNLLQDKNVEDRLRKHSFPEESRHLRNELDAETVDLVIRLCREHYGLVARFYRIKRQILGLPKLTHIDRYAPLFDTEEEIGWDEGRQIVIDAFRSFSDEMAQRADEFFEKNWIDAEVRKGKQGGAFCAYITPDTHPVVMMSYLNKLDNVMTLAHELGHGVHASFSREQSYLNFHGTLPLAELASTFGEMLVFEKLVAKASLKDKLSLYADKIEGVFATVFRQAALYSFEQRAHRTRRESGELPPEQFGEIWQEEVQAMFGDSIELGEQHRDWWSYVGHFFYAPFYVYAYSFGELLVLSLYQMAKKEGPGFADKYLSLLKLGGSLSPQDLMATVGVDLKSEEFWRGGFSAMEALMTEFERLHGEYSR